LTGCPPGEGSRIRLGDVDTELAKAPHVRAKILFSRSDGDRFDDWVVGL